MGRFSDLLNKVTDTTVKPGEEDEMANNPRNALADTVNPYLEKIGIPGVPKMTVADDKNFYANLPEQMGAGTMGSIEAAGSRFGKLIPEAEKAVSKFGSVKVVPTAADLAYDAAKAKNAIAVPTQAYKVQKALSEGPIADELAKRFELVKVGKLPVEEYNAFKQNMLDRLTDRFKD